MTAALALLCSCPARHNRCAGPTANEAAAARQKTADELRETSARLERYSGIQSIEGEVQRLTAEADHLRDLIKLSEKTKADLVTQVSSCKRMLSNFPSTHTCRTSVSMSPSTSSPIRRATNRNSIASTTLRRK